MRFLPIKTRPLLPPKDDLFGVLEKYLPPLKEGDVLLITSKVLAIHQGRCVKIAEKINKEKLIRQEADYFLPPNPKAKFPVILALKDNLLIPAAGIDESNGNGYYILWPKRVEGLLKQIRRRLKKKYRIKKLAIISTDSHTAPARRGVTGIATGFYGLEPLIDLKGKKDIFGRKLKMTQINVPDALAAIAALLMGESDERRPLLIIRGAKFLKFTDSPTWKRISIPPKDDIYFPLLKRFFK